MSLKRKTIFYRIPCKEGFKQMKKVSVLMISIVMLFSVSLIHAARPTVKMTAAPAMICVGGSSTLTWTSTGAVSAVINNGVGSVPVNGSVTVAPAKTIAYTITVKNGSGSATSRATVTVKAAPPQVTFIASPEVIPADGSSTLTWTTVNAFSASIDQGIGVVALNGSKSVALAATTAYKITVKGSGGTVIATATVTVVSAPPPTASLTAEPSAIFNGQSSTLTWRTANAASASIDNGVGGIELNGSVSVAPAATTTYTLTATGPGGSVTDEAQVRVSTQPAPSAMLTASPQAIRPGESAMLSWTTTGADSVVLDNGIGAVEVNGSLAVSPSTVTTYTLMATGPGGSRSASATVLVSSGRKCFAFIPDSTDKNVRVIDTDTNALLGTIAVAGTATGLQGVAAEESGVYVYVADTGSTRLLRIDPLTMAIVNELPLTAAFQGKPRHAVAAPDGRYVYATSSVPMWDPGTGKYVGNICTVETKGSGLSAVRLVFTDLPSRVSLEGLAVSRDGALLFVADPDNDRILALDAAKLQRWYANPVALSDELVTAITLSSPPLELAVSPDGRKLYATCSAGLIEIDTMQFTVLRSLAVPGARFVQTHPDGSRVYVMADRSLSTIETAGLTALSTVAVTGMGSCSGFDIHPDGTRLFMVDGYARKIFMVNAADGQVISTLALGSAPVAFGRFICPMPVTISGSVRQDGGPLGGVTMTLSGEGILRSRLTPAAGDFIFGLKPGSYSLTPTLANLSFAPASMDLQVEESMPGLNFAVSGTVPPPTVTLNASKTWVQEYETFNLSWESTGADYVTLELVTGDRLPPNGSRTYSISSTTTFWAIAYSRGGTASSGVKVYVASASPPTAAISATPASIIRGGSSTLSWKVTNATTVVIDNGIGTVAASGSKVVSPAATSTYAITATHANGYKVTASATVSVSEYDTSAGLTGTVVDSDTALPVASVSVSATDASAFPRTVLTDSAGTYSISGLRVGDVAVSFSKAGYDPCQQTVHIPANTTFDLATQLHATLVGATLKGTIKDGRTGEPLAGVLVSAMFAGGEAISCTSTPEGAYALGGLPLQVLLAITTSAADYYPSTIQKAFSQNAVFNYDFTIFPNSAVATINGTIFDSRSMQPEAGVFVSHQESGKKTNSGADGKFTLEGIPFGPGSFFFQKEGFINKIYFKDIGQTACQWDVFEPTVYGREIKVGTKFSGMVLDSFTRQPVQGAVVRVIGRAIQVATDENGRFSLAGIDPGSCNILVTTAHYSACEVYALVDDTFTATSDFLLHPVSFGTIKGKVVGPGGAPVQGVQIGLATGGILSARTGYDGLFEISTVPFGSHTVEFVHPCFEKASQVIEISQEGEVHDMTVSLEKRPALGKLSGRIVDSGSKAGIANASVSIAENFARATTDGSGGFSFDQAPLGVIQLAVEAFGYLPRGCERFVEAQWDNPGAATIAQDIELETEPSAGGKTIIPEEAGPAGIVVEAAQGGAVSTPDGRLELLIAPNMLPVDLRFAIAQETEDAVLRNGDPIPLQGEEQAEEAHALGATLRVTVSAAVEGETVPDFRFPAVLLSRYSQAEVDAFGGAEETTCFYFNNGSAWRSADIVPGQHFVDPYNNMVGSLVMLDSQAATAEAATHPAQPPAASSAGILRIFKIINGVKWLIRLTNNPPVAAIIYDKDRLNAVAAAQEPQIPNPNALPLLVFNGLVPKPKWETELPDPNVDERYSRILTDLVSASNGVYRPVFISFNTAAHIDASGLLTAQKLHPNGLGRHIVFKGLPADPNSATSGQFTHVDTFGFSMGGLISRYYAHYTGGYVKNMLMLATPNHGTLLPLLDILGDFGRTALTHIAKLVNPAIGDLLDYPDNAAEGFTVNPKLAFLNSTGLPPSGDISLWAGTDFNAYPPLGLALFGVYGDNDSIVPVRSVFCRPTTDPQGNGSLLAVNGDSARYEYIHPFTHENVGTPSYPINNFEEEIRRGLSDWLVCRLWDSPETSIPDNFQLLPTATRDGEVRAMVTLEYNVWDGYDGRAKRDIDRAVIVIYYKDALGEWHIAESASNQNGADPEGNVNDGVDLPIEKTSKLKENPDDKKISAIAVLKANPAFGEPGHIPSNDVKEVRVAVIPLRPGQKTVPKDPTSVTFGVPE